MLWPVKLDTPRNPGTCKANQSRLYYLIIINKMTFLYFVVSHLYTSTQLRKNHDFNIFIFQIYSMVLFIGAGIFYLLYYRIRIYYTATTLIHPFFQKHGVFLRLTYSIGGKKNVFFPNIYIVTHKEIMFILSVLFQFAPDFSLSFREGAIL